MNDAANDIALTNDDLRRIAREVGMLASHDGVYMRSVGTHGGMSAEDGFAFARAAILADRARAAAVPDGFWLAPLEPDEQMDASGIQEGRDLGSNADRYRAMRDNWLARHPAPAPADAGEQAEPVVRSIAGKLQPDAIQPDGTINPKYLAPAAQVAREPLTETCEWSQDGNDDGSWFSACGGDPWYFEAEDPTKNGMRFCIHCGKRMVQRGVGSAPLEGDQRG